MRKWTIVFICIAVCFFFSLFAGANEDAVSDFLAWVERANQAYAGLQNYRADVIMKEQHKGNINEEHFHSLFNKTPRKQYALWQEGGLHAGLQASYVPARDGKESFQGKETGARGLVGVVTWRLDSALVDRLYPHHFDMDKYHLGFLLSHMQEVEKKARAQNKTTVVEDPAACSESRQKVKCFRIELTDNPADKIPYKRAVIGFEEKSALPLYVATYEFNDTLHASYNWATFEQNVTIADEEFEIKKK